MSATAINGSNPLLDFTGLAKFDRITPADITPAIDALLQQAHTVVTLLEASTDTATWDNCVVPLEHVTEKLSRVWGIVSHLNSVADTPELRAVHNENQPKLIEFWTALAQNLALFDKYKAIKNTLDFASLSSGRRTIINNALRDFRLGGAELPADKKARFAAIQEQHAALTIRFSENILDATNAYGLFVTDEVELAGLPDDARQAARSAAERDGNDGYKFTLHFPSYFPILQYADNRALRESIYRANATKASELGDKPEWDNSANIVEILRLRNEEAKLLGYQNYAELSLVCKMAKTSEEVIHFLEDLSSRARPFAEQDLAELRAFAKQQLALETLEAWGLTYAAEKLREQRYAFFEQEVKQYFLEPTVVEGLFQLIEKLFSVNIRADQTPVWHPDVKFFRVEKDGKLIGQFYLDLYARNGKCGGAWMDDARARLRVGNDIQTPIAYLTCNFTAPAVIDGKTKPALFTHDEVITLFHEFGHGLHHLLTQVDEIGVSGISGVEWDAVELPSQFMENFCWEWDVLQNMTSEAESGQPLPRVLYDKMIATKNFQSVLQTLRQVAFSLFDMRLHDDYDPYSAQSVQDLINQVRARIAVITPPPFNRFQHSFGHIFAGGYAAGYYSYKWAEVLSADAYGAFEEAAASSGNVVSAATGSKFRDEILAVGGSRPTLESFKAFRGREPSIDALLRHSGMAV